MWQAYANNQKLAMCGHEAKLPVAQMCGWYTDDHHHKYTVSELKTANGLGTSWAKLDFQLL